MENLLNQLEAKYLTFKLGEEQREALLSVFSFIMTPGHASFTVSGRPGVGKSSICKIITRFLEEKDINYQLATPTHKSKKILANFTGREVITIHQLLTLKPSIDIMDLDMKDLQFSISSSDSIPRNGVLMIDECSMINNDLFDAIEKSCKSKNCKFIAFGDACQIKPVKQRGLAKTFQLENSFELATVYRQIGENCVRDLLEILRKRPLSQFESQTSKDGNIEVFTDYKDLVYKILPIFEKSIHDHDPNKIKLIAYTNKRVQAFNRVIRNLLFGDDIQEYMPGDILFGYDNSKGIENAGDYQIQHCYKTEEKIGHQIMIVWYLEVFNFDLDKMQTLCVLSIENSKEAFENLACEIEDIRVNAINASGFRRKTLWTQYYRLIESFLSPIDIVLDGRTVRCKSIDYGYAITAHKSQSSTFDYVAVDIGNILKCPDKQELRQMEYVAISRTRKDAFILI